MGARSSLRRPVSFIASVLALGDRLRGSVPPMDGRGVAKGDQIRLLR